MSSYLSDVFNPYYLRVVAEAIDETWNANGGVDAFAFSGTSGISVYMALNTLFPGKYMGIFIRKEAVPSHGNPIENSRELYCNYRVVGGGHNAVEAPEIRVSFLDDFLCSGKTKHYVKTKVLETFKGIRFVNDTLWNDTNFPNLLPLRELPQRAYELKIKRTS